MSGLLLFFNTREKNGEEELLNIHNKFVDLLINTNYNYTNKILNVYLLLFFTYINNYKQAIVILTNSYLGI